MDFSLSSNNFLYTIATLVLFKPPIICLYYWHYCWPNQTCVPNVVKLTGLRESLPIASRRFGACFPFSAIYAFPLIPYFLFFLFLYWDVSTSKVLVSCLAIFLGRKVGMKGQSTGWAGHRHTATLFDVMSVASPF